MSRRGSDRRRRLSSHLGKNASLSRGERVEARRRLPPRTKDVSIIHQAKTSLVQLIEDIEASESDLWTGRKSAERLFCEFQISESIRRLCAYGINFAEALLNMLMNERLESV